MLTVKFGGWVQCRLATDPDPYDEPRGVSGYTWAYAGEPDLDRIVRAQDPPFQRKYGHTIGVVVRGVERDGRAVESHPLMGARVDLLDSPKLEGRNGVIAEDTLEPIYPFRMELRKGAAHVDRAVVPSDPTNPYPEFFSKGLGHVKLAEIQRETGISDLRPIWDERIRRLRADLTTASDVERPGIEERLDYLREHIDRPPPSGPAALALAMSFEYALKSNIGGDPSGDWRRVFFPDAGPKEDPWNVDFWLGGWDSDALSFFCAGSLYIPEAGEPDIPLRLTSRPVVTSRTFAMR